MRTSISVWVLSTGQLSLPLNTPTVFSLSAEATPM
jgi:hypothetical protein